MRYIFLLLVVFFNILSAKTLNLPGIESKSTPIKRLYKKIDSKSVIQNFAFYNLYPDTEEGKKALKKAWQLLKQDNVIDPVVLPNIDINLMINIVNKKTAVIPDDLDNEKLVFFESLGKSLKNRKLKGNKLWKIEEIRKLNIDEIDLARAIFLEDLGEDDDAVFKTRYYEMTLDLMALQILAKLEDNTTDLDKVYAINDFIFYEMRFRFPPHSIHAKEIDTFTFLSSVMDSRRGVCLGVSTLYLTLAQRIGLQLESVTPPGHIFVRYKDKNGHITNIETTARGVDYPSEVYLGIETKKLQLRNIKEVVGLTFINQASVYWGRKNYERAIELYNKASYYIKHDPSLNEMLGLNLLFIGNIEEAKKLLDPLKDYKSEFVTSKDTLIEDYLNNNSDVEAIKDIFIGTDETRKSIIEKQEKIKKTLEKFPKFRAGLMQLANTYLQLGREKEALKYLNDYYKIDKTDPVVNYYLSVIYFERFDYLNAWKYFKNAKILLDKENHYPKALKQYEYALKLKCPESLSN